MMTAIQKRNKKLCERYPFLIPVNPWSGRRITDGKGFWPKSPNEEPEYNYEYTELDNMPEGWRIAFGEQMCEEIREELLKFDYLDKYYIIQIKEKYGTLRWYDNGVPSESKVHDIINKYVGLSKKTCIRCGAPATVETLDWYSPWCDNCCPINTTGHEVPTMPIDEFWKEDEDE